MIWVLENGGLIDIPGHGKGVAILNKKDLKKFNRSKGMRDPIQKGWNQVPSPKSANKYKGWLSEMDRAYTNEKYAVLIRSVKTELFGIVIHAAIRNKENTDIPWNQKQKIKNELFGEEREGIEFFPSEKNLIDEANMYHLWIFEPGKHLPFGLTI